MVMLLTNASTTGSAVEWQGGRGMFRVEGNFDGATVALAFENANGTMTEVPGSQVTASTLRLVDLPAGNVQATVTGGAAPSGLYADYVRFGDR